jgi:glutathione S-transferase
MSEHDLHLILGNKAQSSWSLRPWLLMAHFELDFSETVLNFDQGFKSQIAPLSPSGKVPALRHGAQVIWDSLAICEYVSERFLDGRGWPADMTKRALARCVVAEMHAGFASLRAQMPMDVLREPAPLSEVSEATAADIRRICTLWRELLGRFNGPFLFGEFSIADCFYAPVATRLHHYAVAVGSAERAYIDTLYKLPAMQRWLVEAAKAAHD